MQARGQWGSQLAFILAAAGSAIGLGNIWRFPIEVGRNGGAAFVLVYLVCVFLVGLPIMLGEFTLGRTTQKNVMGAFLVLKPHSPWLIIGVLGLLSGFVILSYYSVVAGWTMGYFIKTLQGTFVQVSSGEATKKLFTSFIQDGPTVIGLHLGFMALCLLVVIGGVQKGIERWCKILMPLLFGLLLLLVIRAVTLPHATKGLAFYLKPDFSRVTGKTILAAMGQAFFSLSLGMGAMITYGSYLSKKENLFRSALWVCLTDTLVAFLAGLAIFPALFSVGGIEPQAGAGLIFIVLPTLFNHIPLGQAFGAAFFLLLVIAALTSAISLLEVCVAYFIDDLGWQRKKAVVFVALIAFFLGIPSALSFGGAHWATRGIGGKGILDFLDLIFGHFALTLGGLLISLFIAYALGMPKALKELCLETSCPSWLRFFWTWALRVICPVSILILFIHLILTA